MVRALLCAAVLALIGSTAAAADYDFRGAVLGMTETEFQALPPFTGGGKTDCTPASQTGAAPSDEDIAGTIICLRDGDQPFSVPADEDWVTRPGYDFIPDESGVPRLHKIEMRIRSQNYADALEALTEKLGKPATTTQTELQNGFGAKFPQVMTVWSNGKSLVTLVSVCEDIEYGCITYLQGDLQRLYEARIKATKGSPSAKF